MAIIPNKEVYDHSKSDIPKLIKDLEDANKEVIKLGKSSKQLAKALVAVKKSNDGTEAKKLAEGTNKLTKSTKKLKDALTAEERVKQQILRANAKLSESRSKSAKDLALVRQKTLQQNKALREQAKANLGVKKSTNGLIASFKAMGKQLIGALGITAGVALLVNQFKKAAERAGILNKLTRQLKGTFDITTKEAKKLASQINAMATNFEDVDAKALQTSLTAIVKTFKDLSEQEALDLIKEGFQKGSNNSGEFLDILKEYPGFFKKAGLSASEMFAIINQQVKEGVYSDKGVDAIKEATIQLTENTKIVRDALKPLGESVNLQIRQKVEAGKAFEAMQLISQEMLKLGANSAEAQTIMADVFKGAGEDSEAFVRNLHNVNLSLDDVAKQTSIVSESNLKLSESYNNFVLSVSDGSGVISNSISEVTLWFSELFDTLSSINEVDFANKMKIAANSVVEFVDLISFGAVSGFSENLKKLGVDVNNFKFSIDKSTKALKLQNTAQITSIRLTKEQKEAKEKEKNGTIQLTAAQIKLIEQKKEENKAKLARKDDIVESLENEIELVKSVGEVRIETEQEIQDNLASIVEDAAETRHGIALENARIRAEEIANAELAIREQAEQSAVQLANDIFASFQDERLAKINSDAEIQKQILQDRLDKGVISEEQFALKVAEIEKKQRIAAAKAERNKALFGIAINTAVAIIKAFASLGPIAGAAAAIGIGIAGGIQAAAVLATPLKFAEGTESVPGTGNKDTIHALLTPKERIVPAEINQMLNGIPNSELPARLSGQENNMFLAGLLMQNNDTSKKMLTALLNGGYTVTKNGQTTHFKADGSSPQTFITG